ncbi:MAG: hypothetical protein U0746_01070 [Gemmataceae bacterium]
MASHGLSNGRSNAASWLSAVTGLSLAGLGALLQFALARGTPMDPYPSGTGSLPFIAALTALVLAIIGSLLGAWSISQQPSDPKTLAMATVTAGAGWLAIHDDWDSIQLLFLVMFGAAAVATLLMAVPRPVRWAIVSVGIVFHYCGILSAITSPPPTPWLTSRAWVQIFRPHLEFCYVNNAYQFYSPEPGPANVLWFCITGKDNQIRWIKMPQHRAPLDPLQVEYYRRLSLSERVNANENLPNGPPPEVVQRRMSMAAVYPQHPEAMLVQQYRMPDENSRQFLSSYVRHVAATYGTGRVDADGKPVEVKSIKVYLVQHRMLSQKQYSDASIDPYAKWTYLPFFIGDFDSNGKLLDPLDPMLYWIVPILRDPSATGVGGAETVHNYVELHAGSDPFQN